MGQTPVCVTKTVLVLSALLFFSCREEPVSVALGAGGTGSERAFVEGALKEAAGALGLNFTGQGEGRAGIVVEFFSSWEFENAWGDILISRTWYVPRKEPAAVSGENPDISLEACLDGSQTLIPLEELSPPFAAARVDSITVSGGDYPLVKAAGVKLQFRGRDGGESKSVKEIKRLEEAAAGLEAFLRELPKPLAAEIPSLVWIAAAGDLMLGRGAAEILFREGPAGIFGKTAEILAGADIALLNLEGPVSGRGKRTTKTFNFRFAPRSAQALADAGIDAVLFANNHAFDYGEEAFTDSIALLKEAGIGIAGAGMDEDEAARPWVFTKGGFTARIFGIASFPREASGWDGASVAAGSGRPGILHAARDGAEKLSAAFDTGNEAGDETLDIILFHGGEEWSGRPDNRTRSLYTELVESGADLVIGSHPHIVQGFEWVKDRPVFWSLGNFVFAGMENTGGGDRGLLIRLGYLGKKLVYLETFPLELTGPRTNLSRLQPH
jgi:poly-gamma-glutamate synthesis protein (capsule biosynthesis protein)